MKKLLFIIGLFSVITIQAQQGTTTNPKPGGSATGTATEQRATINTTPVATPAPSGNASNRNKFVKDANGTPYFIDKDGVSTDVGVQDIVISNSIITDRRNAKRVQVLKTDSSQYKLINDSTYLIEVWKGNTAPSASITYNSGIQISGQYISVTYKTNPSTIWLKKMYASSNVLTAHTQDRAGNWTSQAGGIFYAKDWGFVADNVTDNAAAWDNFIANSGYNPTIIFAGGTYRTSRPFRTTKPVTIVGQSPANTFPYPITSSEGTLIVGNFLDYVIRFDGDPNNIGAVAAYGGMQNIAVTNEQKYTVKGKGGAVTINNWGYAFFSNLNVSGQKGLINGFATFSCTYESVKYQGVGTLGSHGFHFGSHSFVHGLDIQGADYGATTEGVQFSGTGIRVEVCRHGFTIGMDTAQNNALAHAVAINSIVFEANDTALHVNWVSSSWNVNSILVQGTSNSPSGASDIGILIGSLAYPGNINGGAITGGGGYTVAAIKVDNAAGTNNYPKFENIYGTNLMATKPDWIVADTSRFVRYNTNFLNNTRSGDNVTFDRNYNIPTAYIKSLLVDNCVGCGSGSSGWGVTGQSGTNSARDYVGTSDNADFVLRANAVQGLIIDSLGNIGLGRGLKSPTYNLTFDSLSAKTIGIARTASGAGQNLTIHAGGTNSGATNGNGGEVIIRTGQNTGTGTSNFRIQMPYSSSSGTSDNTYVDRFLMTADGTISYSPFGYSSSTISGASMFLSAQRFRLNNSSSMEISDGVLYNRYINWTTLNTNLSIGNTLWGTIGGTIAPAGLSSFTHVGLIFNPTLNVNAAYTNRLIGVLTYEPTITAIGGARHYNIVLKNGHMVVGYGGVNAQNTLCVGCDTVTAAVNLLQTNGSLGAAITTVTTNTTLDVTHHTVLVDCTAGAVTITLPTASGANRRIYNILKIDNSANSLTISGAVSAYSTTTQNAGKTVQSNGSNWYYIGTL